MKKLIMLIVAACLMAPMAMADTNKQLQKALNKEKKEKMKEYKKENWKLFASSRTLEVALLKHYDKLNTLGERVMFVFGNTAEMLQFCQGYKLDAINLGATANHDGADQIGGKDSSVFLDATQKADVNQLLDMGIKLYVQQTPTYQSVDIDAKL